MADPFVGEIRMFAGNFAPRGWALCNGQLLPIAENAALFSLLGTTYGGDGRATFGLPDLRDRSPAHAGRGPGLSARRLGERYGAATVTLQAAHLPDHTHGLMGSNEVATSPNPAAGVPAIGHEQGYLAAVDGQMGGELGAAGGGEPHENRPPTLVINFIIALQGVFPARN